MKTILYHDGCNDGFGAAWWLGRALGEHVKIGARWGEPPPLDQIDGGEVYIVDFCYPRAELQQVMAAASKVVVLDHHETSAEWVEGMGSTNAETAALTHDFMPDVHCIVVDQQRSGVGLVADYVEARWGTKPPDFLLNIEDRDLWRFKLPETAEIVAAVTSRPYTVEAWDALADTYYWDLVKEGAAINRYRDMLIDQVAASTFSLDLGGHLIPCVSSPYAIGSDVAGRLAEQSEDGIGAYVILHAEHVQVGLRARKGGPNVAQLAQPYGGGGHPGASGLRLAWHEFYEAVKP